MGKRRFYEVHNPKPDVEYWVVYNPKDELPHYFRTEKEAYEYAGDHNILDINVFKECFD